MNDIGALHIFGMQNDKLRIEFFFLIGEPFLSEFFVLRAVIVFSLPFADADDLTCAYCSLLRRFVLTLYTVPSLSWLECVACACFSVSRFCYCVEFSVNFRLKKHERDGFQKNIRRQL